MTGYLPLAEAAQYVTNKTGKECEPDALLRAGVHGALLIAAAFSGQMRNLTAHKNEDYSGLLTIHPRHLFEIETDGQATIVEALSLDGSACYAPHKIRTREQLRVLVSELDRFIPYIVEITPQHQAAPTEAPDNDEPPKAKLTHASWIDDARTIAIEYIERHRNKDLFPSQPDVCTYVAKVMRGKKIYGHQGKPLSEGYIQRNAIQGEWWKANKP